VLISACLLAVAGAMLAVTNIVNADAPVTPSDPQAMYEECMACHELTEQVYDVATGDTISITIDRGHYESSMHSTLTCNTCHPTISGYPHPERTAVDRRDYVLQYRDTCQRCHSDEYRNTTDSMHIELLDAGNKYAPVCSDCHNPHTQVDIEGANTDNPVERAEIPLICAQCHNGIYEVYQDSVHGTGVMQENNLDTPTCVDCHGVHLMPDPRSSEFRLSSVKLCSDCHTDPAIMDKYGLSTEVQQTYVADFHGTTVKLFEGEQAMPDSDHADDVTNKAVCYDCHGVHDIKRVDDPDEGLAIKENLAATCQRCHPESDLDFPDSWMSHYIPSPEHSPLVYYVQLVYNILIPTVIGGMVLFVATDFTRKQIIDRIKAWRAGKEQ
jgi:hypothetical protein